jgi:glycosyltransferase involved in cell wall biosynthesis
LSDANERYRFVIAGEGSGKIYDDVLALRDQLGLQHKVTFLGLRTDVAEIMRSLDVYVLSSTTEGFSIACIEAMASGTPVVATRSGGPEEILEDERSGLLVPVRNPDAMAGAVDRITSDRNLAANLVAGARIRVTSRYTLDSMLNSYEALFESLLPAR